MNISGNIKIERNTLTLDAGTRRDVGIAGRFFLLESNSSISDVHVGIGNDNVKAWPVGYDFLTNSPDEIFKGVSFYNPTGAAMTIVYIIANGRVTNNAVSIVSTVDVPIDNAANDLETPTPVIALENSFTIDNAAAVNVGGGVVGIPVTGNPFETGEIITIAGSTNYNHDYTILASSGVNQVNITATYVAENFAGTETIGLKTPRSVAARSTRKELVCYNNSATKKVWWGDSGVDPDTYKGTPIPPESSFIISNKGELFFVAETGTGKTGVTVSINELTRI